ncbi:hypothetical protein D3C72_1587800 [compost metagenome]
MRGAALENQTLMVILSPVPMVLTSSAVPTWRNHSWSALTPARKETTLWLAASSPSTMMSAPSPRAKIYVSSPCKPARVSSPLPPRRISLPKPPTRAFLSSLPVRTSSNLLPAMLAILSSTSLPGGAVTGPFAPDKVAVTPLLDAT